MPQPHACPICGNTNGRKPRLRFSRADLITRWQHTYNIDIADELMGVHTIELMKCNRCHLQFFQPPGLAGSPALYDKLAALDWYYIQDKWEYGAASEDMPAEGTILEVGCGDGQFLEKLRNHSNLNAEGIEINVSAVESARRRGLKVTCEDLKERAATAQLQYDAVCSFQVLEHIADPKTFLDLCCAVLRPGGKLILAVPNNDSYLGWLPQITDMPPHHTTRWSAQTMQSLCAFFPLRVSRLLNEPLAAGNVNDFLEPLAARLDALAIPRDLPRRALRKYVGSYLRGSERTRRHLKGHSLYACFDRS